MQILHLKAGLLGRPLSKSLSPDIFGIFAALTGIKVSYELLETQPQDLRNSLERARVAGWHGLNITIPYKHEVCALLDLADPAAKAAGAVNAVRFGRAGLEGFNSDARALLQALEEAGFDAYAKSAVVFGSGGAAASSAWALGRARAAAVTFRARNAATAAALAERFSAVFPGTLFSAAPFEAPEDKPAIFVNATPLGMYAPGRPPCEPAPGSFCADLAYAREGTEFMTEAAKAGALTADGLSLLVRQGALSLRFWAGLPAGDIVKFSGEADKLFRKRLKGG